MYSQRTCTYQNYSARLPCNRGKKGLSYNIEDHSQYIDLLGYKMVMRYRTIASEEFLTIRKFTNIILKRSKDFY